jgi:hypothetical protein
MTFTHQRQYPIADSITSEISSQTDERAALN